MLGTRGELVGGERDMPLPHEEDRPQPGLVEFRDDVLRGNDIRVAYTTVEFPQTPGAQPVLVQVAETLDKRSQLANDIIKGVILPQFVILPLAILLVWFGLSRGLAPLHALQAHIRARRPDDLSPLEAAPRAAGNRAAGDVVQRPADAARTEHGTAEALYRRRRASDENAARRPAHAGRAGAAPGRVRRKSTARSSRSPPVRSTRRGSSPNCWRWRARKTGMSGQIFTPVEVTELARSAVRDWVQAALAKQMDLGYEAPDEPVEVDGNPVMLREMLSNLIDNAIRYTPAGGRITVRVRPDATARAACIWKSRTPASAFRPPSARGWSSASTGSSAAKATAAALGSRSSARSRPCTAATLTIDDNVYQTAPRLAGTLVRVSLQAHERARDLP